MDGSLLGCGRGGHITYAPDEPHLRSRMTARHSAGDEAWRCLRCGTFVPGPPARSGPAAAAPPVRRGKEVRSAFILRIFAIERLLRALVLGAAALGVWRFTYSRTSLQQALNRDLPVLRRLYQDLGFNFSHSRLIGLVQHALRLDSRTLGYLAIGLAAYAVIELIEAVGLWLLKRWGEYFAMIATSVFLPYEIYDLTTKATVLRLLAFLINLALMAYLVITKRLFGVRGGRKAYDARLREDAILEAGADAVPEAGAAAVAEAEAAVPSRPAADEPGRAVGRPVPQGAAGPAGGGAPEPDRPATPGRPAADPRA